MSSRFYSISSQQLELIIVIYASGYLE